MKKFVFSLQSVLKVKKVQQEQKKGELAKIISELNMLYAEEETLNLQLENSSRQYVDDMLNGMQSSRMLWYCNYAEYIKDQLKRLGGQIEETEQKKEEKQTELVAFTKEIKTLEKLRQEQLIEYMDQTAKEEEKEIGDLISYNKTVETDI